MVQVTLLHLQLLQLQTLPLLPKLIMLKLSKFLYLIRQFSRAERRKTSLGKVVQNQQASLVDFMSTQEIVGESIADDTTAAVAALATANNEEVEADVAVD